MITLFSTGCPMCKTLATKLDKKGIEYQVNTDQDEMRKLGLKAAPALYVDGKLMGFSEAVKWVNAYEH